MKKIKSYLPEIYSSFLPEFFSKEIHNESIATCCNCIMLNENESSENRVYYSKETKCCTYFPFIPNYLVGLVLLQGSEDGKNRMRQLILGKAGISPLGISPEKKYLLEFEISREKSFGRSKVLKCPYLDEEANCSVWQARGATCSSYFCRNVCGVDGEQFWNSVKKYISTAEQKLAQYSILRTDDSLTEDYQKPSNRLSFYPHEIDETSNPDYSEIWNKWEDKEESFYINCYEKILEITPQGFEKIMGIDNEFIFAGIKNSYQRVMFPDIPDKLILNPAATFTRESKSSYMVSVYSGSFNISDVFFEMLYFFDGESSVSETMEIISSKLGVETDEDLLITLYQNRVLIKAN